VVSSFRLTPEIGLRTEDVRRIGPLTWSTWLRISGPLGVQVVTQDPRCRHSALLAIRRGELANLAARRPQP